ncbi:MAG: TonB-dependent receptor [Candidatus Margulisiibacteriota bacterium]
MNKVFFCFFLCCLFGVPALAASAPTFRGEEVIVTASRIPQPRWSSPYSTSVVTTQDVQAMGAENLGEALQYSLGVDYKNTGWWGATSSLKLRSSTYQQVLVLVNGRRANSPLMGGAASEDILVGDIQKIEVVRFPASSIYGSDAMGGVINVITKPPAKKLGLDMLWGDFNSQKYLLQAGNELAAFSAEYLKTAGYRVNGDYAAQNYFATAAFDLLKMDLGYYIGDRGVPGSTVYPSSTARQTDHNSYVNFNVAGLGLFYEEKLQSYNAHLTTTETDSLYNCWTYGVDWQNSVNLLKNRLLTYGFEWREDRGDSLAVGNHTIDNQALFLEDETDFGDWKFEWGLRGDRQSVIGDNLSARAGLVYDWIANTQLRCSFGQAYRAPTLNDLYYTDPWGSHGNPNLQPERSASLDLGLTRKVDFQTRVTVNYFLTHTSNLIQWVETSPWIWEPQNIASSRAEGVEFEFTRDLSNNSAAFLNYTYQQAVNLSTGKKLVYSPENKLNLGVRYESKDGLGSALYARYVGERYDDENNTRLVPSYTTIDLKLWQKVGEALVTLAADNLANTQYEDTLNYPMPGRRYSVGVKL